MTAKKKTPAKKTVVKNAPTKKTAAKKVPTKGKVAAKPKAVASVKQENPMAKHKTNGIIEWIDYRLPVFSFLGHFKHYQTPKNLSYLWSLGSIAGIALVIQIITGIVLAMHYTPHVDHAFDSVERIMRDVNYGWLIRYMHAVGASMFFTAVYLHIFRGLYYGSYKTPRELLWHLGIIIFLCMMATAFMGYVLPWGQMSYWGATVITNLFSAIPLVGDTIVTWLWGGFSVDNPTLNRFFSLHYLLPFVIVGLVILHIVALHIHGSNNPKGIDVIYDPVGDRFAEPAVRSLAWGGRYLVVGFAAGKPSAIPMNLPLLKGASLVGVFWGAFAQKQPKDSMDNFQQILAWIKSGQLKQHINHVYSLEESAQAIQDLMDRKVIGKNVVVIEN